MEPPITLSALPMPLRWDVSPVRAESDGGARLRVEAGRLTDLFVDPGGDSVRLNAPRLVGVPPEGDYQFSARVGVEFSATFDAGVLLVWADETRWAKLCFERSPGRAPMIVSVVTRRSSDDANGFIGTGRTVWLRISRRGRAYAFHASTDGSSWSFVRHFDLGAEATQIGFVSQSPTGEGCTVTFEDIRFVQRSLPDLRDGS
jgi:regulation of enolase protein 1 (concanavalin A-like superfamily)